MTSVSNELWPNDAGWDTDYQEHEPVNLTVSGTIPSYCAGVLYRTGPLGYKVKTDARDIWAAKHWFDGLSCVHRFQIDFLDNNGPAQVSYRSRRTVDQRIERIRKQGTEESITFASKRDPCESFFKKVMSMFYSKRDSKNVGVTLSINMPGGGYVKNKKPLVNNHTAGIETLHAKTDNWMLKKIDPETLEPQGVCLQKSLHPDLKGPLSASHAKTDPTTGDLFNFNLELGYNSTYRVFRTSATTGKTDILASFTGKPAYLHSLFLSQNYVILCVWNSHITWGGLSMLYEKNIADAIAPFDPSMKAMWYVVDRHGKGLVATYESDPFFSFHTINAWEEPSPSDPTKSDILCELSLYDNTDVIHRFYYDNLLSSNYLNTDYVGKKRISSLPSQARYRLPSVDASTSSTSTTILPAERIYKADKMISLELPTINPSRLLKPHRYVYGAGDRLKSSFMDCIVKFDNRTQTSIFWDKPAHTPGEPIFVADPAGEAEDDGVLLSVVLDGVKERSYLLVLDARTLAEVGRAEMEGPVAFGFHGAYMGVGRGYGGDI